MKELDLTQQSVREALGVAKKRAGDLKAEGATRPGQVHDLRPPTSAPVSEAPPLVAHMEVADPQAQDGKHPRVQHRVIKIPHGHSMNLDQILQHFGKAFDQRKGGPAFRGPVRVEHTMPSDGLFNDFLETSGPSFEPRRGHHVQLPAGVRFGGRSPMEFFRSPQLAFREIMPGAHDE